MFVEAIEKISEFTRPIHTIMRTYEGTLSNGASTIFFVNEDGVAITCKHVAELLLQSDSILQHYNNFKTEKAKLLPGKGYRAQLQGLESKSGLKKHHHVQIRNQILNGGDFTGLQTHLHPTLDLAIIVFQGFSNKSYTSYATFVSDNNKIKNGKYLCRYGFPFPEFSNYRYDATIDEIEFTQTGNANAVPFPIEGMLTRLVNDDTGSVMGIELSTPGLKGQSGGPLFDKDGLVYGMQASTMHLHLGFDIKDMEVKVSGKTQKVSDVPFLHVGRCVHVDRIKEFLTQHNIKFYEG